VKAKIDRIWSGLGCFGLTLLAIMFALGVTESIKYVSLLEKMLVLTATVLTAGAVAYLRDRFKHGRVSTPRKSEITNESQVSPLTPPPPGPTIHEAILESRTQAILFRQIVPPNHDPAHLSFFGGLPIAPSGFQWPRGNLRPYSFIMQVDCSAVPAEGRLGMFPDRGVMYLFLDLTWGQEEMFRVVYESGPVNGWSEIAPPDDLPHAFDSKLAWRWPQSDDDWPRLLPKWPFDPVVIKGGPIPEEPEEYEGDYEPTYAWPGTIRPNQAIPAIEGAAVQYRGFWYGEPKKDRRPFAGFPHDWNAIRITTGLLTPAMKREVSYSQGRNRHFRELSDEEYAAKLAAVQTELREWSDRASAAVPFDAVPAAECEQFWSWVKEHEWLTRFSLTDAADLSVEASLTAGPEAAARIPLEIVEFTRSRHALAYEMEGKINVNIPDRMLAPPVDVQGTIDDRVREFILLFEMSSNEGLAHYFGEGVYQFWIRPEDLAARRFDRVELSTTAY
jgi:hypothetical protein